MAPTVVTAVEVDHLQPVMPRITRGEGWSIIGACLFAELLSIGWIGTLLGVETPGGGSWWQAVVVALVDLLTILLILPPLFVAFDRWPLHGAQRAHHLLLRSVTAIAIGTLQSFASIALTTAVVARMGVSTRVLTALVPQRGEEYIWGAVVISAASTAYYILRRLHLAQDLVERNMRLRTSAVEAQLQALSAELRPHFLFNSLNNLAELVHQDPARAERMLLRLSSLLRASLDVGRERTVSLATELDHVDDYLALQELRFGDRLRVERRITVDPSRVSVPPMLLQPIVENAIVHGLEGRPGAGLVRILAEPRGDLLAVVVEDDGPGPVDGARTKGTGVGLRNVRERLSTLYGDAASLTIDARGSGGARVTVLWPADHAA
jgi:two-component system, LytTR family, sensor kinase